MRNPLLKWFDRLVIVLLTAVMLISLAPKAHAFLDLLWWTRGTHYHLPPWEDCDCWEGYDDPVGDDGPPGDPWEDGEGPPHQPPTDGQREAGHTIERETT